MAREHETFAVVLVFWTSFIFYESKRGIMHDDSFGPLIGTKYATKLKVGTGKSFAAAEVCICCLLVVPRKQCRGSPSIKGHLEGIAFTFHNWISNGYYDYSRYCRIK